MRVKCDKITLQKQAEGLVFAESEVTAELKAACEEQGIRLNIIPDEQYEQAVAASFGEWLLKKISTE